MPFYDFVCGCGKTEEKMIPISKRNDVVICSCGEKMNRVIGNTSNFVFRGEGTYHSDYIKSKELDQKTGE